jgi:hypothetical protein
MKSAKAEPIRRCSCSTGAEQAGRWACAVARRNDNGGFLITAYPTDAIKEGVRVWPK